MRYRRTAPSVMVTLVLWAGSTPIGAQDAAPLPPDPRAVSGAPRCPVDDVPVTDGRHGVEYAGRHYLTDSERCQEEFLRAPERYARGVEPRAALFYAPPHVGSVGYSPVWLVLGVYVLIGLVSGGVAAYLAVQKGQPAGGWFAKGLALNLVGVAMAARAPARPMAFERGGLTKIPSTHAPASCPRCGRDNHPSATRCADCGTSLVPQIASEVDRATPGRGRKE